MYKAKEHKASQTYLVWLRYHAMTIDLFVFQVTLDTCTKISLYVANSIKAGVYTAWG